jgi:arsenate reductase
MTKPSAGKPLILSYATCSTCRKALAWLKARGVDADVRPMVLQPPTPTELAAWIPKSGVGVKKWLNTSGASYRAFDKETLARATEADLVAALSADGKLVKRPVLVHGDRVLVGFREEAYAALFPSPR